MANETLIARLEQNLRQSRATRTRLAARLAEIESEADIIRAELIEMVTLAGQTEAAIVRLLSNVMSGPSTPVGTTSVGELEVELQRRIAGRNWRNIRLRLKDKCPGAGTMFRPSTIDSLIGPFPRPQP
jgi:hypothetical protein